MTCSHSRIKIFEFCLHHRAVVLKDSKPAAAAPAAAASNPKVPQPIEQQQPKPQQQQQGQQQQQQQQQAALQGSKAVAELHQKQEELEFTEVSHKKQRAANPTEDHHAAYQVLQQIHPGTNIDNRATKLLVAMSQWTMTSIASLTDHTQLNLGQLSGDSDAALLLEKNPRFFAALETLMPGELAKNASSEATKAVIRASSSSSSNSSAWSSAHAGLQFDPCAAAI
jgi:hypothetical protein